FAPGASIVVVQSVLPASQYCNASGIGNKSWTRSINVIRAHCISGNALLMTASDKKGDAISRAATWIS
ncbi:MAG TPA: hypothetical protein VK208_14790, partial [Pyrinomonadaceae bacterium]|nr:hypothetical protein [Pyrinomonadaceae bacterium]